MGKTIVFVHGAWLTSSSWENWTKFFQGKGYETLTPEWPYRDASVAELQKNTPDALAQIGVTELVDHYEKIIRALPKAPIIIGHSFGGLITQQLLDRGVGSAGVALDGVAGEGVFPLDWNVLKANMSTLGGWMNWDKVLHMTFPEFQFAFVNEGFSQAQQKDLFERYVVPESGRLFFQAAFAQLDPHHALRVNFKNNDRAPLLLIAGEHDHLVPAAVVKRNYEHHQQSTAHVDFKEFAGRSHLIGSQDGWQEVADYVAGWLDEVAEGEKQPSLAV